MADMKKLMGLGAAELQALGLQSGLQFPDGMKKSAMVQQLMQSQASGWMDEHQSLVSGSPDEDFGFIGSSDQISDAAHAAQMIAGAGFTETFHHAMGAGQMHHVEAINSYMERLGTNAQDVWMHMPHANPNVNPGHWGSLNAFMRDTLTGNQDIMPELPGHYSGDIMSEYATSQGDVSGSYNYLASMYVDKGSYESTETYDHDVANVAQLLAATVGPNLAEVAFTSAIGGKASYVDALPQIGDPSIAGRVRHPRMGLTSSGYPVGSMEAHMSGRDRYSLGASLSGMPDNVGGMGSTLYHNVKENVKSLAQAYRGGGERGMNPHRVVTSDYDSIMDSATRYVGLEEARSGYANLDEPSYSGSAIRQIVENQYDKMESGTSSTFDPAAAARSFHEQIKQMPATGTGFSAKFDQATDYNFARARRESKLIADMDAASAPRHRESPVKFHEAFEQGTDEWLDFRKQYDVTGSTIGSYLGHNKYTSPIKEMADKIGYRGEVVQNADMRRGHELEPIARARVAGEIGQGISEVGAITNENFPRMMYSPDGLIGDDAIWEHKAPRKFFDLNDHQDYQDQMQLGMMLSGRNRALFSQTVGSETRSQWVDQDPEWFEKNKSKIDSTLARMDAGRRFEEENPDLSFDERKAGVRQAMTGEGIWGFQTTRTGNDYYTAGKRGMSRFSPSAGGSADEFLSGGASNFAAGPQAVDPTGGDPTQDRMALSVKSGIILANEEMKQRKASSGGFAHEDDADFDDLGSPRGVYRPGFGAAGGGSGGAGGGFGGGAGGDMFDRSPGGSILSGIAGGTMASTRGGFMQALREGGPLGQTAALGIGALGVAGDFVSTMSDYIGSAQDAGMSNANQYAAMSQGMEMLGMSQTQAEGMNRSTHSAYNRLRNGDPSLAASITANTRGLITISDINETQGDPTRLAAIFRQRAKERGWDDAQIAGAAEMSGLQGLARTTHRSDLLVDAAQGNVDIRGRDDVGAATEETMVAQGARSIASPDYLAPRAGMALMPGAGPAAAAVFAGGYKAADGAIVGTATGVNAGYDLLTGTAQLESGGDPNAQSKTSSARGAYQVLDGTARDPGFGVRPAQDDSNAERDRVGRDYLVALTKHYDGDERKAAAAYTDGPGTLDKAVKDRGADWLSAMPSQAQKRVENLERMGVFDGANRFTGSDVKGGTNVTVNLDIKAQVNQREATAKVEATNGQTVTQSINMAGGSVVQRR